MAADRLGNSLQSAKNLGTLSSNPVTIRDAVGRTDQTDVCRFNVSQRSSLNVQLSNLRKGTAIGVDVFTVKNASGKAWRNISRTDLSQLRPKDWRSRFNLLARSTLTQSSTPITLTLPAGEYYLRISSRKGTTPYTLITAAETVLPRTPSEPATPGVPVKLSRSWIRQLGTSANDYAYGISVQGFSDAAQTIELAGSTEGSLSGTNAGDRDSYAAQYTSTGTLQWTRQFGKSGLDAAADTRTDSQGNYYVAGVDIVPGTAPNPNGYLAKFSSDGTELWRQVINTTVPVFVLLGRITLNAADAVSSLAIDAENNVYITGFVGGIPDLVLGITRPSKTFVAKYGSDGTQKWFTELDLPGSSGGTDLALDSQGNVYLTGITNGVLTADSSNPFADGDIFVAKFSTDGAQLWNQSIAAPGRNFGRGLALDSSGNVYITGETIGALPGQTSAGSTDAFLAKYDNSGTAQWLKQFGTPQLDEGQAIAVDRLNRIYVTGETAGSLFGNAALGQSDAFLAVFDPVGNVLGSTQIGTARNDETYGIAVANPANPTLPNQPYTVYLTGQTQGTFPDAATTNQGNYDTWLAQYSITQA